jgi:hypothetical protein
MVKKGVFNSGNVAKSSLKRELAFISFALGVFLLVIVAGMFFQNTFSITGLSIDGPESESVSSRNLGESDNSDVKEIYEKRREEQKKEIEDKVVSLAGEDVGMVAKNYVEKFVSLRGVDVNDINDVREIDFDSLPGQVSFDNVNKANLAIYGINYSDSVDSPSDKEMFVVVYSIEQLKNKGDIFFMGENQQFLIFGSSDEMTKSGGFLESASGVQGSIGVGYVMLRSGSITGLSTNLNVMTESKDEMIDVIVYKNGEPMSFGNSLDASSQGIKKDLDIQSSGTNEFEAGDVISVYVSSASGAEGVSSWKEIITIVEVSFSE